MLIYMKECVNEYEKVYNYFFILLIVILGIKLFRNNFIQLNNNTENNDTESKDIEIVDNDEIMIYKLTADNVNSINEKISKYGNIIRIMIFCLQDNDIDLSLLNKLELQFSDLELNVYIDSDKSLKGLNKIDGTIDLNIYGTDKQKIDLSDLNNIRFLQIRSCTIDDKSGWGNMTNIESAILYNCILNGFGDCSKLDKLRFVGLDRGGCNSDDAANFYGGGTHLSFIKKSPPTGRTPISYAGFCFEKKKKETIKSDNE